MRLWIDAHVLQVGLEAFTGGWFGDTKHKQCAELMLSSFLSVFSRPSLQGHVIAIELEKEWVCRLPRPAAVVGHVGVLGLVCTSSGLDLSPAQGRAEGTLLCYMCTHCMYVAGSLACVGMKAGGQPGGKVGGEAGRPVGRKFGRQEGRQVGRQVCNCCETNARHHDMLLLGVGQKVSSLYCNPLWSTC